NVVAVKEASGNLGEIMDIIRDAPRDFRVLAGDDALALAIIALGGEGGVWVVSNEAPEMVGSIIDAALDGDLPKALQLPVQLLPLINANFIESNSIPVKAVLAMMGMIEENYRLPMVPIGAANREKLASVVRELGLLQTVGVVS